MHNISCTIFTNLHALISPLFQVTHTQTNNLNLKHISLSPIETFFCSIHFPLKFSHTQKWQQSGAYCAIAIVHVRNHDCGMSTHLHVQVHVCKENITQPTDWNVNQILRNADSEVSSFMLTFGIHNEMTAVWRDAIKTIIIKCTFEQISQYRLL